MSSGLAFIKLIVFIALSSLSLSETALFYFIFTAIHGSEKYNDYQHSFALVHAEGPAVFSTIILQPQCKCQHSRRGHITSLYYCENLQTSHAPEISSGVTRIHAAVQYCISSGLCAVFQYDHNTISLYLLMLLLQYFVASKGSSCILSCFNYNVII